MNEIQSEHLFLLMGENPLPNAVAISCLLQPGGTPYLIHTIRTKNQAINLAASVPKLGTFQPARLLDLGDSQAEASVVWKVLQTVAGQLTGKVGLNYTGGTKAMSVHAYRALSECHPQAVFSYLDSNTLEMVIDNDQAESYRFKTNVAISLEQLIHLHGLTWRSEQQPLFHPIQPQAAQEFAKCYQSVNTARLWRGWCYAELSKAKTPAKYWQSETDLEQLTNLDITQTPRAFKNILSRHFNVSGDSLPLRQPLGSGFRSLSEVCGWLEGIWLEHYVLSQVQKISQSCHIQESGVSFHIQELTKTQIPAYQDKFEFDILFMRYHQLFALSCTTSTDRKLCKQKLMECSVRAKQLGGIEARIGLVCCRDDQESLKSELEVATRDRRIMVRVEEI